MLKRLDDFPEAILVAGCQRSGTTAIARMITDSDGMAKYRFGPDDELDAALILSAYVDHEPKGRYCFQTTYLNNCHEEYLQHRNYKLIWVLRTPRSVVYSMLHNWKRGALNRLFHTCGSTLLGERAKERYERFGIFAFSRLTKACLSYNAKVSQVFVLKERLRADQLLIVDYDDLTSSQDRVLPVMYDFAGLPFKNEYSAKIHSKSRDKAEGLSKKARATTESTCLPVYDEARKLINCS